MQPEIEKQKRMRLRVECNADLVNERRVEHSVELLTRKVNAATVHAGSRLSEMPLLLEAERTVLVSYAHGRTLETNSFRAHSLIELMEAHAIRRPSDAAIVAGRRELTWENLIKRSCEYAAALKTRGVRKGSLVAVRMEPRTETAITCVALLKLSAIVAPVPSSADTSAWESVGNSVSPDLAIAAKGFLRPSWATWNYEALAAAYIRPIALDPVQPEDVACMMLSSTPSSRGVSTSARAAVAVPVDHQTAVRVARGAARSIRLAEGDLLQILPATEPVEAWSDLMMGLCAGARTVLYTGVDELLLDRGAKRTPGRYVVGSHVELMAAHCPAPETAAATILCRDGRLDATQYQAFRSRGMKGFTLLYAGAAGGPVEVSEIGMATGEGKLAPIAGAGITLCDQNGQWPASR